MSTTISTIKQEKKRERIPNEYYIKENDFPEDQIKTLINIRR